MAMPPPQSPAPKAKPNRPTSAPEPKDAKSIKPKLTDFEIEKKVGKGQFSIVYKARYKQKSKKTVALKKIKV